MLLTEQIQTGKVQSFSALVLLTLVAIGCGRQKPNATYDSGAVGLTLQVNSSLTFKSVTYAITGPNGFSRIGTIDESHVTTRMTVIAALPPGTGFKIIVDAVTSDGTANCTDSDSFDIVAHATTSVVAHLLCHAPVRTGSVLANGSLNICPTIDSIAANPIEAMVGGTIALASSAHDPDGAPGPLAYIWTASSGMFGSAIEADPTLTCTTVSQVTATLRVTDGDCSDSLSIVVRCTGAPDVRINEIESNNGVPGDWVEFINAGTASADISDWVFKDNDDSHAGYVIPAGTVLPPSSYLVLEEAAFAFGLGATDSARLFDTAGHLVDSYSWSSHAATTYGRCPNGTGPFVTTNSGTKGADNDCGSAGSGGSTGMAGADAAIADQDGGVDGGEAGSDDSSSSGAEVFPWPGSDPVVTVDEMNAFGTNLSGLDYQPAAGSEAAVLWAIQNSPSKLYRLLWNGAVWSSDTSNDWTSGKLLHYPSGLGSPDSEGVSKAEWVDSGIYVSTERDNDNGNVSRLSVLRFDTAATGVELVATNDWNLTADLPMVGSNLGLEAITYIPDTALVAGSFFDEASRALYDPAKYPNHGAGLFFVGLEGNGSIYGYALNHLANTFTRVATFPSGQPSIMDLAYDREVGYLWAYCDNTCGNKASVFRLDSSPISPAVGRFSIGRVFDRPSTLPNSNNEGITFAPESQCTAGQKAFFWSDDDQLAGHAIRRGSIPCGHFF